jgi:hypothetical protein
MTQSVTPQNVADDVRSLILISLAATLSARTKLADQNCLSLSPRLCQPANVADEVTSLTSILSSSDLEKGQNLPGKNARR